MRFVNLYIVLSTAFLLLQACQPSQEIPANTEVPYATKTMAVPVSTATPVFELSQVPFKAGFGYRAPWLELYFTDPTSQFSAEKTGGVDGPVSAAIVSAKESVDVALNSLGVNTMTEALIRVHQRGVKVRVVMETDNLVERANPQLLIDAGIPVIEDKRAGTMHNSFVVIDNNQVWTGSVNYTSSGIFRENNNLVRIFSNEIAEDFTKEFNEMFVADQFGDNVVPDTPYPKVKLQEADVEVLFSPDDVVVSRLSQLLNEAQTSIYIMAYSFDSKPLGEIIREKAAGGVQVAGVFDALQTSPDGTTQFDLFNQAGYDFRLSNVADIVGHKVMIIDGKTVVLGSYDFTSKSENENDENVLIIHNEKIAQKFMEEFQRLQARAQP